MRGKDYLLAVLLRVAMPKKYCIRGALEVTGAAGAAIEIVHRLQAARAPMALVAADEALRHEMTAAYFLTATKRLSRGALWSIIAPPFILLQAL